MNSKAPNAHTGPAAPPLEIKPLVTEDAMELAKKVIFAGLAKKDGGAEQQIAAQNVILMSMLDEIRVGHVEKQQMSAIFNNNVVGMMQGVVQQLGHIAAEMTTQRVMGAGQPGMMMQEIPAADAIEPAPAKKTPGVPEKQLRPGEQGYL